MDQDYPKSVIYITDRPERVAVIKAVYPEAVYQVVSPSVAVENGLSEMSRLVFVFIESDSPVTDKSLIVSLRNQLPLHCPLILLRENLNAGEGQIYASLGVNDILNPQGDPIMLRNRLAFFETHPVGMQYMNHPIESGVFEYRISRGKRLFDVLFASLALALLSPLLLIVALAIRIESEGKAIYQSKRVGSGYRVFGFYKFRSMYADADRRLKELADLNQYVDETEPVVQQPVPDFASHEAKYYSDHAVISESDYLQGRKVVQKKAFVKLQNDPRVTRVGRIIRKLSIDELPQLINVLKGDMSIVGNRPLPLYEAEMLTSDDYLERFLSPAGLTGLWQVEKRGRNSSMSPEERKQLDIYYARNNNFWLDMKILLKTIPAMIQREDV